MSRALVIGTLGLLLACAAEDAPTEDGFIPDGPPEVWPGQGLETYAALSDGDALSVYLGPQGGYMVYVSYRASGIRPGDPSDPSDPTNPRAMVRLLGDDGQLLGAVTRRIGLETLPGGLAEGIGTIVVFNPSLAPELYLNQAVSMELTITDNDGRVASATRSTTAVFSGEDDVRAP